MVRYGFDPDDPLTFLVLDGRRCLTQSDVVIHLIAQVGGVWRLIRVARLVPRRLRDALYGLVARNHYRWFGRRTSCYPAWSSLPPGESGRRVPGADGDG